MSANNAHPDKPHPGGDPDEPGCHRKPGPPHGSRHRRRPRKPAVPLWRPNDGPRDVNLEMTPDDLDRSPASRQPDAPREQRHRGPRAKIDFREQLGLGRSLRERFMPPGK